MSDTPKSAPRPTLKAVRGTRDLLPDQTPLWNRVESTARAVFSRYGFGEIRTPIFESTDLFARGVGEETDIVSKEMFTWEDGGRAELTRLEAEWLLLNSGRIQGLISHEITPVPAPQVHKTIVLDGVKTFVEFRVFPPVVPDTELIQRATSLLTQAPHIVVVPRSKIDGLTLDRYKEFGISVEEVPGKFITSDQSLTLRPENTAGVVRAYIEHKLGETGQLQKLYYIGPQFRRERPQRGRYRQFWQIGAEVIGPQSSGSESPLRDAEVLEMLASLLDELGIRDWKLELNSVGSSEDRVRYNEVLRKELNTIKLNLCADCQRRADINPLRVLDCKVPEDQPFIDTLPKIADHISPDSATHFQQVLAALDACAVPYHLNPRLVRGLDYYTRTTFEFTVTTGLGTQNALLGGGRYDGLSEMLGGPRAPGIGFAIGEDRLILTLQAQHEADGVSGAAPKLDAYIAPLTPAQNPAALALARELRAAGLTIEVGEGTFKLRKSFDIADTLARHIILLGEDEVATNTATVKTFATGVQTKVERPALIATIRA